jgi:UDP-GlcNAc:undecaprenyl-phosphate/decaprenyl-phosphate GlcNAc-1-phosphate transferase
MLLVAGVGLVAAAFVLSWLLCGAVRVLAPRIGLVDKPGGRKAHKAPTPLGGGVAIWLTTAIIIALGAFVAFWEPAWLPKGLLEHTGGLKSRGRELAVILGLGSVIMLMGLADDRFALGWKPRLAVQFALATILVLSGVRITLFFTGWGAYLMGVVTVFWIVGLTNAFNFLDNMDGLAASVGLIAALLFAGAQVAVGSLFVPAVLLVLVGALGGFLVHNRPPARLFMGDAGSNFLGFTLGALTVAGKFTGEGYSPFSVLTPLLVMAVPIYDMASVIWIRLREGRSPFQADRRHFSHRLVDRGLSPGRAVATIDLVTLASGLGALLLHDASVGPIAASIVVAQTLCLLGVVVALEVSTPTTRTEQNGSSPSPEPQSPSDEPARR